MEPATKAKLLRIFIGEADKLGHKPLYEVIVQEARSAGLAGATVWRGVLGYGHASRIRSAKILDLSTDLPIIVEITDYEDRINVFLAALDRVMAQAGCGGLVTMEQVEIIKYTHDGS